MNHDHNVIGEPNEKGHPIKTKVKTLHQTQSLPELITITTHVLTVASPRSGNSPFCERDTPTSVTWSTNKWALDIHPRLQPRTPSLQRARLPPCAEVRKARCGTHKSTRKYIKQLKISLPGRCSMYFSTHCSTRYSMYPSMSSSMYLILLRGQVVQGAQK